MEQYFYQLNTIDNLSFIPTEISKKNNWTTHYSFDTLSLSPIKFYNHKLFKMISKFEGRPTILKMEPMHWYNWHTDAKRQCAINSFIEGPDSRCFFGEKENDGLFKLTELVYEPGRHYLFNTQEPHAVLNGNNVRYMLSIGFVKFTYRDILTYCKENNL